MSEAVAAVGESGTPVAHGAILSIDEVGARAATIVQNVETVFLLPDPANAYVSSSLVRQVAALGGDVVPYVPAVVGDYLQAAMTP